MGLMAAGLSFFGLGAVNPDRIYGPRVYATKNEGKLRPWKNRSRWRAHQGDREIARRKRQIEAGKLQVTHYAQKEAA